MGDSIRAGRDRDKGGGQLNSRMKTKNKMKTKMKTTKIDGWMGSSNSSSHSLIFSFFSFFHAPLPALENCNLHVRLD